VAGRAADIVPLFFAIEPSCAAGDFAARRKHEGKAVSFVVEMAQTPGTLNAMRISSQ
jgi:hypothetical protein